jgi:tetratricopeptide (TPR) repeat protein
MIRVWPIIAIGMAYLLLVGGSEVGANGTGFRLLNLLLLAVAFGGWAWMAYRDPRWQPASVLWPALLVVLVALAVTTFASRNGRLSQDVLAHVVILAGLYLLVRLLMTDARPRALITGTVTVLAAVVSGLYLLAALVRWIGWWLTVGSPALPPLGPGGEGIVFGDPETVAAVAILGLVTGVAHVGRVHRRSRLALYGLAALTGAAVIVSGSMVAWIAALVTGAALAGVGIGRTGATAAGASSRLGRRGMRRLAAMAAIVIMLFAVAAGPGIAARFIESGRAAERVSLVVVSARMLVGAPVTGTGPGTWADQRIANTVTPETDAYVANPGSGWLTAIVETGVVGLAALAFAAASVLVLARSALADADPARRRWGIAALAAMVYVGAHQLLGVLTLPAALALLAVPVAWLDATEQRPMFVLPERLEAAVADAGELGRRVVLGAGLAALAVAILSTGLGERSAMDMDQARSSVEANDWAGALRPLANAAASDPELPAALLPLGLAQARAGDAAGALATFAQLAETEDLPVAWMNRAWLEAAIGDDVAARRSINGAMRLGYQQPQLAFAAGLVNEQLGDLLESTRWYVEALVLEPRLAGSGFWRSGDRAARWDPIREAVLGRLTPAEAADFWLALDDVEAAAAAIIAMPAGEARALLERVIAAWSGEPGARDALAQYARDHADDVEAVAWSARVASHAGDTDAARRYREWAATVAGGPPVPDTELTIELPPISAGPKAGLTSLDWGAVTYGRPTPASQLLPDMPQLAFAP